MNVFFSKDIIALTFQTDLTSYRAAARDNFFDWLIYTKSVGRSNFKVNIDCIYIEYLYNLRYLFSTCCTIP